MEVLKEKVKFQKYPGYKDSGVEWLGEAPEHWEIKRLGSLLNPISKKNRPDLPLLSITREKGVIARNIEDEEENHNYIPDDLSGYKVLREGQFGMNKMKAWQGSYGISKYTGIVSPAYYVFDFFYEVDPNFFNIAIRSKKYVSFFGSASDGVRIGQWDLSKSRMKSIPFLLPPKQEQIAIAGFLDEKCVKIDAAIAQKQKLIEHLKERKQIIIQNAVTKGLDPDVKMKDSGVEWIGEIPEHWDCIRIKHLSKKITDGEHISPEFTNDGMPFLSAKDIRDGYIKFPNNKFVSYRDGKKFRQRCNPEKGDLLLVSRGATIGRISQVDTDKEFCLLGSVILIKTNHKIANDFIVVAMANDKLKEEFLNTSHHSAQQAIYIVKAAEVYIPAPPLLEQNEIVSYLEIERKKIDNAIQLHQQQIEKLKEYKSSLIDAAVTGKIKVS
ncbi:restriction endonuclease subunit S [Zunongwangia sp. HGR-M22]|uniref:restriction endonuclease subunit S n=1 Tax=Zunongwangia sp. HGR-M22 TaxID=3015168 RepID=UPI0022DDD01F|nr:restriction endonuclease subunit S [Zunongwangia sp. HGR-M22]WBL24520.1 restriction endonuclease subunit S [Zunongwangia sp. HGR-M22]